MFLLHDICDGNETELLNIVDQHDVQPFPIDNNRCSQKNNDASNDGNAMVLTYKPMGVHVPIYHSKYYANNEKIKEQKNPGMGA